MKQNLTKIKVAFFFAATLLLASCGKYEKTPSGLTYKISKGKGSTKIKQGNIVKFNIEYKLGGKDSILNSTYGKMPGFIQIDSAKLMKHNFTEIITKLALGDKAEFVMSVDTLKNLGQIPAYDNVFKKGGVIKGKVEILKIFTDEKAVQADYEAEMKKEQTRTAGDREKQMKEKAAKDKVLMEKQTKELKEYADKNKIKVIQSPLGTLVEIQNEGTGAKADTGKHAMLTYRGYLTTGKVFDANVGIDAKHKDLLDVAVGKHNVIPGMEDALKYFGKGGKGRLLIPSVLAYGDQGSPDMPANSNLIFDIEVMDVTNEPAKAKPELKLEDLKK
jgi:FKBP-type peptidyl-prolyl cis-trans isomerase FkpA